MVQDKNHDRGTPPTLRPSQMSQEEIDAMKWRGIIRAVHWRNMDEPEICARSCDLASLCSPGEYYVPKWVQSMYYAMGRYVSFPSILGMPPNPCSQHIQKATRYLE
jgi:hypothetical protein